jgi:hypothetical protein
VLVVTRFSKVHATRRAGLPGLLIFVTRVNGARLQPRSSVYSGIKATNRLGLKILIQSFRANEAPLDPGLATRCRPFNSTLAYEMESRNASLYDRFTFCRADSVQHGEWRGEKILKWSALIRCATCFCSILKVQVLRRLLPQPRRQQSLDSV